MRNDVLRKKAECLNYFLLNHFDVRRSARHLRQMSASAIAQQILVSGWYAGRIREGYRPHPRHWEALAELVGISADA